MLKRVIHSLWFLALVLFGSFASSQTAEEYAAKSDFMVKMTHFISWPETAHFNHSLPQDFIFCIEGSPKYFSSLEDWSQSGTIKNKNVQIKYIHENLTELDNCNILFISRNYNPDSYLKVAQKQRFLTISDKPGNSQLGVVINFANIAESLRFEINLGAARELGFDISPRLLKLATIVNKGEEE